MTLPEQVLTLMNSLTASVVVVECLSIDSLPFDSSRSET